MIQHKAYLVAKFRLFHGLPQFVGVEIFSSPTSHLTAIPADHIFMEVFNTTAPTFQEAHDSMIEFTRTFDPFQWAWVWLAPGREAHEARFELMELMNLRRRGEFVDDHQIARLLAKLEKKIPREKTAAAE